MFDAFIVISSFILDVIFLDSRWYETGKDATTILVLLLPWRVVRIVNSKYMVVVILNLVLLNPDMPSFENSVDPDQKPTYLYLSCLLKCEFYQP